MLFCSGYCSFAIGVTDPIEYAEMENEQGIKLADLILDFQNYDRRTDKAKHEVRVVLLGCVRAPGVYEIDQGVKIGDFIGNMLIKGSDHHAHSLSRMTKFFRLQKDMEAIDPSGESAGLILEDGDVIYIPAVVL